MSDTRAAQNEADAAQAAKEWASQRQSLSSAQEFELAAQADEQKRLRAQSDKEWEQRCMEEVRAAVSEALRQKEQEMAASAAEERMRLEKRIDVLAANDEDDAAQIRLLKEQLEEQRLRTTEERARAIAALLQEQEEVRRKAAEEAAKDVAELERTIDELRAASASSRASLRASIEEGSHASEAAAAEHKSEVNELKDALMKIQVTAVVQKAELVQATEKLEAAAKAGAAQSDELESLKTQLQTLEAQIAQRRGWVESHDLYGNGGGTIVDAVWPAAQGSMSFEALYSRHKTVRSAAKVIVQTLEEAENSALSRAKQSSPGAVKTYRAQKLTQAFELMDLDGNGSISSEELAKLAKARRMLGQRSGVWTVERNERCISQIDTDRNGDIDCREFVAFFSEELPQDARSFEAALMQLHEVAKACRQLPNDGRTARSQQSTKLSFAKRGRS